MDERTGGGLRASGVLAGRACIGCGDRSPRHPHARLCSACHSATNGGPGIWMARAAEDREQLAALDARVRRQSPRGAAWWWR